MSFFLPFFFLLFFFKPVFSAEDYVTCNFRGQLGNQMFQIATTVAYALENQCTPVFPEIFSAEYGKENYENVFFRLNIKKPRGIRFSSYDKEGSCLGCWWIYNPIPYNPGFHLRLHGYFQSEKYFRNYTPSIRALFSPKQELVEAIYKKYGFLLMGEVPTVAVHIRTWIPDGLNPETRENFSWDYFIQAIHYFPENFRFLIFSDAIEYVKQKLPDTKREIYFMEGNSKYIDFFTMSFCTHQVVSPHSTFSWWAAWLNKNPNKIVIVQSDLVTKNTDAYPETWIKLER